MPGGDRRGYGWCVPSLRIHPPTEELRLGLDRIRAEFEIPAGFLSPVEEEAAAAAAASPGGGDRRDARELSLLTIDPPGSRDLDQAYGAERLPAGYRVHYAIADVAAFVAPGGAVDAEAWARGQTVYMPDHRARLYPTVLSEGVSSLLPDADRAALLWTIDVDDQGEVVDSRLERAVVRSRRQLTYADAQAELDGGGAEESLVILREVGLHRERIERERGGISLNVPTRRVTATPEGYRFATETVYPVEGWNAQISLLAGHCAAAIMADGGVGLLRTLPPVSPELEAKLRRVAEALDVDWSADASLAEVVRTQDGSTAQSAAFLTQATRALRGASYAVVDGPGVPHGGLAMLYAHVTAPLRRLADRHANEVVVALCAGGTPPAWATDVLTALPEAMADADRRADAVEAAVLNLAEAVVMSDKAGRTFDAVVIDVAKGRATVQISDPPVVAKMEAGALELGERIRVRLTAVDAVARTVEFETA